MFAVEGRAGMGGDVERAQFLSALGIEGVQLFAGGKPDALAVIGDAVYPRGAGEGAILTDDFGHCSTHAFILVTRQRGGEQ